MLPPPPPPPGFAATATFWCNNINHTPLNFKTNTQRIRHIIEKHTCPISGCNIFSESDAEMQAHMAALHADEEQILCDLCNMGFSTQTGLDTHVSGAHVKCIICKDLFKDYASLSAHDPCTKIMANSPVEKDPPGAFLEPEPKSDLDKFRMDGTAELCTVLATICTALPVHEDIKADLLASIERYGATQRILEHQSKYPFKLHKMRRALLQAPSFQHQGRETLSKVSDFLGKLDTWNPGHKPGDQMNNFLALEYINNAVKTATSACALSQKAAVAILLKTFSSSTLEAMESYTFVPQGQCTYTGILKTAQDVFFADINLEDIAFAAETAKIQPHEKFHEFFLRAFTLLKTASLGRSEREKLTYIELNLRRLSLGALPQKYRLKIENLEWTHGITYTAHDICNFVTSERISEHSVQVPPHADLNHIFTVSRLSADNQSSSEMESEEEQVVQQYDNESEEGKEETYEGQLPEPDDPDPDLSLLFKCKAKYRHNSPCLAPWFEWEQDAIEHLQREHNTNKRLYDVFTICPQ